MTKNLDERVSKCYCQDNVAEETRPERSGAAERSVTPKDAFGDFDNLELIPVELAAKALHVSVKTLYDWKYRGQVRETRIPHDLFAKLGGKLYVRKTILNRWIQGQNSSHL